MRCRLYSPARVQSALGDLGDHLAALATAAISNPPGHPVRCIENLSHLPTAKNEIGRERELAADRIGAELATRQAAASALVKLHGFGDLWETALQRMRETLTEGKPVPNVSAVFADYVAETCDASRLIGLDDESLAHPLDTHPPLKTRLAALGITMDSIQSEALKISSEDSAVRLVDDYEKIEAELTKMEEALMVKKGEVSQAAQIRCPACGKQSPVSANACICGFRFGRAMA